MLSSSFSRNLLAFFSLFILLSCSSPTKKNDAKNEILKIDFNEAAYRDYFNASEVISNIEYVALETSSECLLGEVVSACISENFILTFSNSNCLLFSRKGQFIRRIGQRGNGPQDFKYDSYRVEIDEHSDRIYLLGLFEICAYRISGQFVKRLDLFEFQKRGDTSTYPCNVTHWKDNLFCGNMNLNSGKEPHRCIIFNLDGEIIKLFPSHIFFNGSNGVYSSFNSDANIYLYNDQLFFKERLCDTLFRITNELDFVPEIIFDLPGYKMPTEVRGESLNINLPDFFIGNIQEVKDYLLLYGGKRGSGYLTSLYDKNKNQLISIKSDPFFQREMTIPLPDGRTHTRTTSLNGLRNDIDGGLPFSSSINCHIQNNNQLINIYQSYFLKEKLTDEHFKRYTIKDQEAHKRLKKLLEDLDWDDNPVITIATFK